MNRDFGSIFSTLLPGTSAKLQPPEGESVMAGLEVKVAFGSVWKETLTELSGGQRSLLALSLILSLLLFKPGEAGEGRAVIWYMCSVFFSFFLKGKGQGATSHDLFRC